MWSTAYSISLLNCHRSISKSQFQNWIHYLSSKTCCSSCTPYLGDRICLWRTHAKNLNFPWLFSLTCPILCFMHNKRLIVSLMYYSVYISLLCSCFSLYLEFLPIPKDKHLLISKLYSPKKKKGGGEKNKTEGDTHTAHSSLRSFSCICFPKLNPFPSFFYSSAS